MSRTWVHTPNYAKMKQERWRGYFQEEHDHRAGECDIDKPQGTVWWYDSRNCYTGLARRSRNISCNCWMCTNSGWNRLSRRSERHAMRRLTRDLRTLAYCVEPWPYRWLTGCWCGLLDMDTVPTWTQW